MKKVLESIRSISITILIALLVCLFIYYAPLLLFFFANSYHLDNEDFYQNQDDFSAVTDFLKVFAYQNSEMDNIHLGVSGNTVDTIRLIWNQDLELNKKTKESLVSIVRIFPSKHSLDTIIIDTNSISFVTKDGLYWLVFSLDNNKPAKQDSLTNRKYKIKKIKNHWYHKIQKKEWI